VRTILIATICVLAILISGCIDIESIDQPFCVSVNQTFTVHVEIYTVGGTSSPYFGVCLPIGWVVPGDSLLCTGVYNETIYYDSSLSFNQAIDFPPPEGYYWWAGSGPGADTPGGIAHGELQIQNDGQLGCFSLDYAVGDSYNGLNYRRSDNHLIWAVDSFTPTGLQVAEGENSVIVNWCPPAQTGGLLGYNIYRDQEIINTNPVVDTTYSDENALSGAHFYTVSSLYHNGDEHIMPYEIIVVFGEYLYVSPAGDNSNNGSSFESALQTITYALSIIRPDSLHPKTVLLGPGVYSSGTNGEEFPIILLSYLTLEGTEAQTTILDAGNNSSVLQFTDVHDVSVATLTATNGGGAGISCLRSDPTLSNIIVSRNSSEGIYCNQSSPIVVNSTISGNVTGIECYNSSNPQITNAIIWGNYGTEVSVSGNSSAIIAYSDVWGGWEGAGNIDANPLFVGFDSGDYNVCSQSPCIDSGDPAIEDPDGTPSDIGVYFPEHQDCFVGNVWHVSTSGNDTTGDGSEQNPYQTIQHSINAAIHGDTIIAQNGIYIENINLNAKNIIIASNFIHSDNPVDIENTIIDGDSVTTAMVSWYCDTSAMISGFTIKNGSSAGIYCARTSLRISHNIIRYNYSTQYIGGIYCNRANPIINQNIINDNTGSGIYCYYSSPLISNNSIKNNRHNNPGGGISCWYSNPAISGNTIYWNSTGYRGGGIACMENSNPAIINNTISMNSAMGSSASAGGGLYCYDSNPTLINIILWDNEAPEYAEIYLDGSSPVITYSNIEDILWPSEGNISEDPFFVAPYYEDFNLCAQSPCIDAGDPDINDPDNTRSDIGVFHEEHPICEFGNIFYVSPNGNDTTGDGSAEDPFGSIQHAFDVSYRQDTIVVGNGTYIENIDFQGKNNVLTSMYLFTGDTLDIRNTIIDGGANQSVILINECDYLTTVNGFTITNGNANYGGGIHCIESNSSITNNYILANHAIYAGGGIYCYQSSATIRGNIVRNNTVDYDGGGISCMESSDANISFNLITNNVAGWGGGIFCRDSSPTIINNTVSRNTAVMKAGAIFCDNSSPEITNTILWMDSAYEGMEIYVYASSLPVFSYCDIEGGWEGEGNIDEDPLLCSPDSSDFWLAENSPCIGAGQDGDNIGAYAAGCEGLEIYEEDFALPLEFAIKQNYPNPFNSSTLIKYELPRQCQVKIDIYDILGRRMATLQDGLKPAGYHQAILNASGFSSGVYFYKLQAGDYSETKKMVLIK
jgi:hypothetical protein